MGERAAVLTEIARVVKPTGILGVMKFKKIDGPPGPPIHIRLSPVKVVDSLSPYSFEQERSVDVGPHNYVIILKKNNSLPRKSQHPQK